MSIIHNELLRTQLYNYLKEKLNSGELKPGDPINQRQISQDLGISKTPFRDCMIQLESEGIVTIIPCKGVIVRKRSFEEFIEIHEMGRMLEAGAFELALHNARRNKIPELTEIVGDNLARLADGDLSLCHDNNIAFHQTILGECPNARLADAVLKIRDIVLDFPRKDLAPVLEWELVFWNEHKEMLDIIKTGTPRQLSEYSKDVHWCYEGKEEYFDDQYNAPIGTMRAYLEERNYYDLLPEERRSRTFSQIAQ